MNKVFRHKELIIGTFLLQNAHLCGNKILCIFNI